MKLLDLLFEKWTKPKFWYHGTSKRNYEKILKDKYLKPSLADNEEFGNGVWFTYDFDYAKDIAGRNTIIFALDSKYLHLFKKEYTVKSTSRLKYDLDTDLIIKEKVPLKYLKVVTNKI